MSLRSSLFLGSLGLLGGCGLVYPYGDYKDQGPGGGATTTHSSSSGTTSSSSSASSSGGGTCSDGNTCVGIPSGWFGPIALKTGDTIKLECDDGSMPLLIGGTGLNEPQDCSPCSCTGPSGGTCPTSVKAQVYTTASCTQGSPFSFELTTVCQSVQGQTLQGALPSVTDACAPSSTTTPQAAWADPTIGCSTSRGTCSTGACVSSGASVCIYQKGKSACPTGFDNRSTILYEKIHGGRECTPCQCVSNGVTCTPTVSAYAKEDCALGSSLSQAPLNTCVFLPGTMTSGVRISDVGKPSGGSCAVSSGGLVIDAATPEEPSTVCCRN